MVAAPSTVLGGPEPLRIQPTTFDTGTIGASISQAVAALGALPSHPEFQVLVSDLRSHLRLLLLALDCRWLLRHLAPEGAAR